MDETAPAAPETAPERSEGTFRKVFLTVTPFSKYAALALFSTLPFVGFWLGMQFAPTEFITILVPVTVDDRSPFKVDQTEDIDSRTDGQSAEPPVFNRIYVNEHYSVVIPHPGEWELSNARETIDAQLTFEEQQWKDSENYVHISIGNYDSTLGLKEWLESHEYFPYRYHVYSYETYKDEPNVELVASLNNPEVADEAFLRINDVLVYLRNGYNDNTKINDQVFLSLIDAIVDQSQAAHKSAQNTPADTCSSMSDLKEMIISDAYFRSKGVQQSQPPDRPERNTVSLNAVGSYCLLENNKMLASLSYFDSNDEHIQSVFLLSNDAVEKEHAGEICASIGDFVPPVIFPIDQDNVFLYCASFDIGNVGFDVKKLSLSDFSLTNVDSDSEEYLSLYNQIIGDD